MLFRSTSSSFRVPSSHNNSRKLAPEHKQSLTRDNFMLKIHMRLQRVRSFKFHIAQIALKLRRRTALVLEMSDRRVLPLIRFSAIRTQEVAIVENDFLRQGSGVTIFSI